MFIPELFNDKELNCPCCGKEPDEQSVRLLYAVRLIYGKPIIINSGARCEAHNKAVGGKSNSAHLIGAFDCVVPPADEWRFIQITQFCGFTGIGIKNNNFIHIDRHHEKPAVWGY